MATSSSPLGQKRVIGKGIFFNLTEESRIDRLTYPISIDYVQDWTAVRAMSELVANAIDEDKEGFSLTWENGCLIIEDNGAGISETGHLFGGTQKSNNDSKIGTYGEGMKICSLVLARNANIGRILFETVGYSFEPTIVRANLLPAQMRQNNATKAPELLAVDFYPCDRTKGTRITIECDQAFLEKVKSRFLHFKADYKDKTDKAQLVDGEKNRVYIGGVLVKDDSPFHFSYNLPLSVAKRNQNRDRNVIDGYIVQSAVQQIWREENDPNRLALWIEGYFQNIYTENAEKMPFYDLSPQQRVIFRQAAAKVYGNGRMFYNDNPHDARNKIKEAKAKGYKQVPVKKSDYSSKRFLTWLGVLELSSIIKDKPIKRAAAPRVKRPVLKVLADGETEWITPAKVEAHRKVVLDAAVAQIRLLYGNKAIGRVRVYRQTKHDLGWPNSYYGFYDPKTNTIGVATSYLYNQASVFNFLIPLAAQKLAHAKKNAYVKKSTEQLYAETLAEMLAVAHGVLTSKNAMPVVQTKVKSRVLCDDIKALVKKQMDAKGYKNVDDLELATAVSMQALKNLVAGRLVKDKRELEAACDELGLDWAVMYLACRASNFLLGTTRPKYIYGRDRNEFNQAIYHLKAQGGDYKLFANEVVKSAMIECNKYPAGWEKSYLDLLAYHQKNVK